MLNSILKLKMKRRKAIKNIFFTTGLLTPVSTIDSIFENFSEILFKKDDVTLIGDISKIILVSDQKYFPTIESRSEFILNIISDCFTENEVTNYKLGLQQFRLFLTNEKIKSFIKLSKKKKNNIIESLLKSDSEIGFFLQTIKNLSLRHFMTSEEFMKKYLKYEFMPGRYLGNVKVKK